MADIDVFLTDEFITFSQKIAVLHDAKKAKQDEMAVYFEKMKAEIKEINEQAAAEKAVWDDFVAHRGEKKKG